MNDYQKAIMDIKIEIARAETQHPHWPSDIIHQVSIMNEEAGESIKAALDHVYHGQPLEDVRKELIQTGAMVVRCLVNLKD